MIKNEREYRITKAQLDRLRQSFADLRRHRNDSALQELQEEALRGQMKDLEKEVNDYEFIWASKQSIPELQAFREIPQALIKARLSLGLSQKGLAERLGLKEQQIQRYESNE